MFSVPGSLIPALRRPQKRTNHANSLITRWELKSLTQTATSATKTWHGQTRVTVFTVQQIGELPRSRVGKPLEISFRHLVHSWRQLFCYSGAPALRQEWSSWRRAQPYAVASTAVVSIAFGGAPYGATNRVRGVPKSVRGRHATAPDKGPSVDLLIGPRSV